jgi:hypothetical protein
MNKYNTIFTLQLIIGTLPILLVPLFYNYYGILQWVYVVIFMIISLSVLGTLLITIYFIIKSKNTFRVQNKKG